MIGLSAQIAHIAHVQKVGPKKLVISIYYIYMTYIMHIIHIGRGDSLIFSPREGIRVYPLAICALRAVRVLPPVQPVPASHGSQR